MKLYLTEILKEANEFGFANQGGSSQDTSFSNTYQPPTMPLQGVQQPQPVQQSPNGMMLPPSSISGSLTGQANIDLTPAPFKPSIL